MSSVAPTVLGRRLLLSSSTIEPFNNWLCLSMNDCARVSGVFRNALLETFDLLVWKKPGAFDAFGISISSWTQTTQFIAGLILCVGIVERI